MNKGLLSVGIDVGTTTTQLVLSRLTVENQAGRFAVPQMVIADRQILYRSPVEFTPLRGKDLVDGEQVRLLVEAAYRSAGICREEVDTGAVIITGETSRKENAAAVLQALAGFAGDFVVATAGPELESVLAAKGAGAVEYSKETEKQVLHMDIGGGTSNLALLEDGRILRTGCLNVGGRLIQFDENRKITYRSPALDGLCDWKIGEIVTLSQVEEVARLLVQALEMAAGFQEPTDLLQKLWTAEAGELWHIPEEECVISFSGGVADCLEKDVPWAKYGDIGPVLGRVIRNSRLCEGEFRLGKETIRATVIGAGSHSVQLSGSTVFHRGVEFPLKNRPVVRLDGGEQMDARRIRSALETQDEDPILSIPGMNDPDYTQISALAEALQEGFKGRPVYVAVEGDMAKALGQRLAQFLRGWPILCLDGIQAQENSYLDVGAPVGTALPVVVKTLILEG